MGDDTMKLRRRALLQAFGVAAATACGGSAQTGADAGGADASGADAGGADVGELDAVDDLPLNPEPDGGFDPDPDVDPDAGTPRADAGTDARMEDLAAAEFSGLPERPGMFPLGVMAGDAESTSAVFWTKYAGAAPLVLRVLEMNGNVITAVRYDERVTPTAEGFVHVTVGGLRPGRRHRYAFLVAPGGTPTGRSLVGRVRAAVADDALVPLTFGGTCCTSHRHAPLPALIHAGSRTDLDFFIHGGDHVYTDLVGPSAFTLADYRDRYVRGWSLDGLRALHRSTGLYTTWDDHEVANDWNPETIPDARLAAARRAYFEHRSSRRDAADRDRIWRSFRWGRTAEVFLLDSRSERRPSTRDRADAQYLSRAQMDWLKAGLRTSPAVFKFVVSSVPITANWNGYGAPRREILRHIVDRDIRGVVWLGGDIHYGGVARVEPTGDFRNQWEVIIGPGGADHANPIGHGVNDQWPVVADAHNYTVLRADPMTRTLDVEFIGAGGGRIPGSRWTRAF